MIGVDEVGRGCLAGPLLVVAARQIGQLPDGLRDSKKLSKKERERLHDLLAPHQNLSGAVGNRIAERQVFGAGLSNCCDFGEGWVKATEIDYYGLSKALKLGALRALRNLPTDVNDEIILDGSFNYIPRKFKNSRTLIGGDDIVPIISAASIHAKVTRDRFMIELAKRHPAYQFESHVGYGTKAHMLALETKGALKYVHRHSFLPIAGLDGALLSKPLNGA